MDKQEEAEANSKGADSSYSGNSEKRKCRRRIDMENQEETEANPKLADSAYSNSCSNSQSRKSNSTKSTHSASRSSGSSGYGGGKVSQSASNEANQEPKKCKKSKKRKLSQAEENVVEVNPEKEAAKPDKLEPEPELEQEPVFATPKPPPAVQSFKIIDVATQSELDIVDVEEEEEVFIKPIHYVSSNLPPGSNPNGFTCVVSMENGIVLFTTSALTSILGFPKDLWLGRSFIDFLHPKDRETFASQITTGVAIPEAEIDFRTQAKVLAGTSMLCRLRRHKGFGTGFAVRDQIIAYIPFVIKFTFKNVDAKDKRLMYLMIQVTPFESAYKEANEVIFDSPPYVMHHTNNGTLNYMDVASAPYLGYFPQDIKGLDILGLYHPEDLPYLKEVYESIIKEGKVARSKPYRLMAQNGDYVTVETEWSSFVNPWSMKLECVTAKHYILQGPKNPDVFQTPKENTGEKEKRKRARKKKLKKNAKMEAMKNDLIEEVKNIEEKKMEKKNKEEKSKEEKRKEERRKEKRKEEKRKEEKRKEERRKEERRKEERRKEEKKKEEEKKVQITEEEIEDEKITQLEFLEKQKNKETEHQLKEKAEKRKEEKRKAKELREKQEKATKELKESIMYTMNNVLTKPAHAAVNVTSDSCKDMLRAMECVVEDPKGPLEDQDFEMLGAISPHHDQDSKCSAETPVSYNQLNYTDNLQRYFDSNISQWRQHFAAVMTQTKIMYPNQQRLSPMAFHSRGTNEISSGESGVEPMVECQDSADQLAQLTEAHLKKHTDYMEVEMVNTHRQTRSSKEERQKESHESQQKVQEHLQRCNAAFEPTLIDIPELYVNPNGEDDNLDSSNYQTLKRTLPMEQFPSKRHCLNGASTWTKRQLNTGVSTTCDVNAPTADMYQLYCKRRLRLTNGMKLSTNRLSVSQNSSFDQLPTPPPLEKSLSFRSIGQILTPQPFDENSNVQPFDHHPTPEPLDQPSTSLQQSQTAPSGESNKSSIPIGDPSRPTPFQRPDPNFDYELPFRGAPPDVTYGLPLFEPNSFMGLDICAVDTMALTKETVEYSKSLNLCISQKNLESCQYVPGVPMNNINLQGCQSGSNTEGTVGNTDGGNSSTLPTSFFKTDTGSGETPPKRQKPNYIKRIGWAKTKNDSEEPMPSGSNGDDQDLTDQSSKHEWYEKVCVSSELVYTFHIATKPMEETLDDDRKEIQIMAQPPLVTDQLSQLYTELEQQGMAPRLTLEEGITTSSSSGEDRIRKMKTDVLRNRQYSRVVMIYEENAPIPPPLPPSSPSPYLPSRPLPPFAASSTHSRTPSPTAPSTPSPTASHAPSPTASRVPSPVAPRTPSPTAPSTPSPTASHAPSPTASRMPSPTASRAPSPLAPRTPSPTASRAPSLTDPRMPSPTASRAPSPTEPRTSSSTASPAASRTPSPTASRVPSPVAPRTPSPTASRTPSPTAPRMPYPTASRTPSPTAPRMPYPTASRAPSPTTPRAPYPAAPLALPRRSPPLSSPKIESSSRSTTAMLKAQELSKFS